MPPTLGKEMRRQALSAQDHGPRQTDLCTEKKHALTASLSGAPSFLGSDDIDRFIRDRFSRGAESNASKTCSHDRPRERQSDHSRHSLCRRDPHFRVAVTRRCHPAIQIVGIPSRARSPARGDHPCLERAGLPHHIGMQCLDAARHRCRRLARALAKRDAQPASAHLCSTPLLAEVWFAHSLPSHTGKKVTDGEA